jgi:glucans biosynthesis protein C
MSTQPRLYALDNLRAIMMWLGIVIHVCVNHVEGEFPIPWRDPKQTLVADVLSAFIHSFRMPVFFIIAGFFIAMLMRQRGPLGMFKHRLKRLAVPFVIFWPLIFPATIVLVMMFVHLMVRGSIGVDPTLVPAAPSGVLISTLHLWFLYLLVWFCAISALLQYFLQIVPRAVSGFCLQVVYALISSYWGVFLLALPLAFFGASFRGGVLTVTGSFVPPISEWIHHGLFFVAGLVLFNYKAQGLALLIQRCWVYIVAGLAVYAAWVFLYEFDLRNPMLLPQPKLVLAYCYNSCSWLLSFGIIGAFLRYYPQQTPVLQYFAASSYWSYLVHMLGTIGFGVLLFQAPIGALAKMSINMILTTAFCLITYHLFVRGRAIGRLLNGEQKHL